MTKSTKKAAAEVVVHGIKGFDIQMQCRGYQFAVGSTYAHEGNVIACQSGFHAISGYPLAVFEYYAPGTSKFCRVEMSGALHSDDQTKTAAAILKVGKEIGISDLITDAVNWITARTTATGSEHATGYQSAASATGDQSAASATGCQSAASATGDQSAASATGNRSAASATGYRSAASATGDRSAASATGDQSAAMVNGYRGTVSGIEGVALFAVERDTQWNIISVACGIVGKDGIQADIQYCAKDGKLVEDWPYGHRY